MSCPFQEEENHEKDDDGDADEVFKLEKGGIPVPVPSAPPPRTAVGVREFAKGFPLAVPGETTPDSIPAPLPELPDVIGVPFPEPPGVEAVVETIRTGIGQVPTRWRPSPFEVARILANLGLPDDTERADVIAAVAEDATADSLVPAMKQVQLALERGLTLKDVVPAAAIPLLKLLLRQIKARPGLLGAPGPADPPRPPSTFRTGQAPHRSGATFGPQVGGKVVPPSPSKPTSSGKGFQIRASDLLPGINMGDRIRRLTRQSPRRGDL